MTSENDENEDIEIISTHDERLKLVGEIFSNDSSMKILNLLNSTNEMTSNEIAQNTGLSLTLVTHHLRRMQSAQLVKVHRIGKSIKGNNMKYYAATNQSLLIVPSKNPEHSIVDSLKKFSKFVAIGLAGLVSWITVRPDGNTGMPINELPKHGQGVDTNSDLIVIDEWSSDSESKDGSDMSFADSSEMDSKIEPQSEPMPESEPSHSGIEEFVLSADNTMRENTGSVSLDRTVYPVPFDSVTIDFWILSIIIPVAVVVVGIILERVMTRWYKKRQGKKAREKAQ